MQRVDRLQIVELGGGRGTNARVILETLRSEHPELFEKVQYTLLDSSTSLLELQQHTLSEFGAQKVHFRCTDLMDVSQGDQEMLPQSNDPTVVIALEVWDNLPHDKIRIKNGVIEQGEIVRADTKEPLQEAELDDRSIELDEVFRPLTDPLIRDILAIAPAYKPRYGVSWIPSVACGLLRRLEQERHQSSVLVADFDWLPPGDFDSCLGSRSMQAQRGEPIITCMDDSDHPCYLQAPILSDILFPTDFHNLATFCRAVWNNTTNVKTYKQGDFLATYGPDEVRATMNPISRFSPMVADFTNCSVLAITGE